jgi:hypothetical protein
MQIVFKMVVSKICYGLKNVLGLLSMITHKFAINIFGYNVCKWALMEQFLKRLLNE